MTEKEEKEYTKKSWTDFWRKIKKVGLDNTVMSEETKEKYNFSIDEDAALVITKKDKKKILKEILKDFIKPLLIGIMYIIGFILIGVFAGWEVLTGIFLVLTANNIQERQTTTDTLVKVVKLQSANFKDLLTFAIKGKMK